MASTAPEYIQHHLTHLNNFGGKQESIVDFSYFNFDTAVFSVAMMILALWVMYIAARKATSGVPGKWQCAVEMLVDMVADQAKSIVWRSYIYRASGSNCLRLGHFYECN